MDFVGDFNKVRFDFENFFYGKEVDPQSCNLPDAPNVSIFDRAKQYFVDMGLPHLAKNVFRVEYKNENGKTFIKEINLSYDDGKEGVVINASDELVERLRQFRLVNA